MVHGGRLFEAYGYATQACDIYLASDLVQGEAARELEEQGMVAKSFGLADFEWMILEGEIRDAATVAAFGLLRLKGMI